MTVSAQIPRNSSVAVAGATVFPYAFKIINGSDLLVKVNDIAKTYNVDYTLTGIGADGGGNITFSVPMVGGEIVSRNRNMALARSTDYQVLGDLHASTMNNDIDAAVLMAQQVADQVTQLGSGFIEAVGLNNVQVFAESGETINFAKRAESADIEGAHVGISQSGRYIGIRPIGSGADGPVNADYGLTVSAIKKDFSTTAVVGEIDAINVAVRQGGATSDGVAVLGNVATYGSGFMGFGEGVTSIIAANVVTKQVRVQMGICDNVTPQYFGYYAGGMVGALDIAYLADTAVGSTWNYLFRGKALGVDKFTVDGSGLVSLFDAAGNKKSLRCSVNAFSILDNAGASEILNLSNVGALTVPNITTAGMTVTAAAPVVAAGQVAYGGTTAATATAGASGAAPAQVAGYIIANVAGTARKIPYYAT